MTKTQKPAPNTAPMPEAHTEVKPHDVAQSKLADEQRRLLDPLPKTLDDDAVEDLFNDMPV